MILSRLTDREVEALATLKSHPEFRLIIQWIERSREELRTNLEVDLSIEGLRQKQGGAQTLGEILTHVTKSREYIEKGKARS